MSAVSGGVSEASRKELYSALDQKSAEKSAIEGERTSMKMKVESIEEHTISKTALKNRYAELARIFGGLPKEKKRKLIRAILKEVSCRVKKREDKGQVSMLFWGDGTILEDWDIRENPEALASRFHRLILPIILRNSKHGQKIADIDPLSVGQHLDVDEADAAMLAALFAHPKEVRRTVLPRVRIDKVKLACEFQALLDTGAARNKADLARQRNVSRAWISTVLKHLPPLD